MTKINANVKKRNNFLVHSSQYYNTPCTKTVKAVLFSKNFK